MVFSQRRSHFMHAHFVVCALCKSQLAAPTFHYGRFVVPPPLKGMMLHISIIWEVKYFDRP